LLYHFIDDSVFFGLKTVHEKVPVGVGLDLLQGLLERAIEKCGGGRAKSAAPGLEIIHPTE